MAKKVLYKLPEDEYDALFIKILAMAVHLKLLQPAELTFWFESGKTKDFIMTALSERIIENRGKR